jgi:hypothetical protein
MKPLKLLFFCLFVFCLTSPVLQSQSLKVFQTGAGPEDMVIDSLSTPPRLLISCASRRPEYPVYGEIEAIDPVAGTREVLIRTGEPTGLVIRPHGISLVQAGEIQYLYVISHDDKNKVHSVIRYQLEGNGLVFVERFDSRLLVSPNALQAYPDGSFVVCNDAGNRDDMKEKILGLKKGNILFYDGKGNWTIAERGLGMPCGLTGSGNTVYVSATRENLLYAYTLTDGSLSGKKAVCKIKSPDNIRFYQNKLLITSHCKAMKFIGHTKDKSRSSPSLVVRVDPATGKSSKVFYDDGRTFSAASVALVFRDHLILGQIFEPAVGILNPPFSGSISK